MRLLPEPRLATAFLRRLALYLGLPRYGEREWLLHELANFASVDLRRHESHVRQCMPYRLDELPVAVGEQPQRPTIGGPRRVDDELNESASADVSASQIERVSWYGRPACGDDWLIDLGFQIGGASSDPV